MQPPHGLARLPVRWNAIWKDGAAQNFVGAVHISMNDYLIHRAVDIGPVALAGMRLRRRWREIDGALGLWFGVLRRGRRQISVSVWRSPNDLKRFVRSPEHLEIMRAHRTTGALYTNAWSSARLDRAAIWNQATNRLRGRVEGVRHH